ncbi:hypothetical protein [Altericroceibacterium xinjiangense]|uniref:hypothetical protein n=1 Tax=Altericroceibacterium xinjiangense TaxID=762261 RepID=UPI000F7F6104|nr:hypothetical protein [Altericroceibacterium xinjiangense]
MRKLLLGAALALAVGTAQAAPENGKNKSAGEDVQGPAMEERAEPNAERSPPAAAPDRGSRGPGTVSPASRSPRGNPPVADTDAPRPRQNGPVGRENASAIPAAAAEAGPAVRPPVTRPPRRGRDEQRLRQARRIATEPASIDVNGNRYFSLKGTRLGYDPGVSRPTPLIGGCPPGLTNERTGCLPPGQARSRSWVSLEPKWWGLAELDGRYVYHDGYLLRRSGDRVTGYVPLLGGALSVGNGWPSSYQPVEMPDYYVDLYALGSSTDYRYANNVIYRIEPRSSAITSIAAMLTGDRFAIGEKAPPGYDLYNIPVGYRDHYIDRANAVYRYSDGYIYEIDPATRLVRAAIELMAN